MPIPIRLEEGQGIRSVLGAWAQHVERALREHFPTMRVSRIEHEQELLLFLSDRGTPRAEIVLRWERAAPNEIGIFPQPPRASMESRARAHTLAFRVAAACVIAVCALWLGAVAGYWNSFWGIPELRARLLVVAVAVVGWAASTFGLAFAAYYLFVRLHRAVDAPRVQRNRQWIDAELWPWLQAVLKEPPSSP